MILLQKEFFNQIFQVHAVALLPGEENIQNENEPSRQASPDKYKPKKPVEKLETKVPVPLVSQRDQLVETKVQPQKKERQKKPMKEVKPTYLR